LNPIATEWTEHPSERKPFEDAFITSEVRAQNPEISC
jgi:hypothetical protein